MQPNEHPGIHVEQTIPGAGAFSRKSETFSLEPICRSLGDPTMAIEVLATSGDLGWQDKLEVQRKTGNIPTGPF